MLLVALQTAFVPAPALNTLPVCARKAQLPVVSMSEASRPAFAPAVALAAAAVLANAPFDPIAFADDVAVADPPAVEVAAPA